MAKRSLNSTYQLIFILSFVSLLFIPLRSLNLSPDGIEEGFYGRRHCHPARADIHPVSPAIVPIKNRLAHVERIQEFEIIFGHAKRQNCEAILGQP